MDQRYKELRGISRGYKAQPRPSDCTLLVQSSIFHGIVRREDIVTEVATKSLSMLWGIVVDRSHTVSNDDVGIESETNGDTDLVVLGSKNGWQPSWFSVICHQEAGIVFLDKLIQQIEILFDLLLTVLWFLEMTGHGDFEMVSLWVDFWEDFLQLLSSSFGFGDTTTFSVFELKEGLSNWIRVRDSAVIDKSYVSYSPSYKISGELATEGTCTKEQTFEALDLLSVKFREQSPLHELDVEVNGHCRECFLIKLCL